MANTIRQLDTVFVNLINDLMTLERQPLQRLTQRRDEIQVQKAVYNDLRNLLEDFQNAVKGLNSSYPLYAMTEGRAVKVSNTTGNATVLTASAGASAAPGTYEISDITLARQHRVFSSRQEYTNQALNLTGSFYLGGAATASVSGATGGAVAAFGTSAVESGLTELGTDSYAVETRQDGLGGWQFRVVNRAGEAVTVKKTDGSGTTSEWQSIPVGGVFDTGRGLTVTFGSDPQMYTEASRSGGAALANYTARGALIEVNAGDTLIDVVTRINRAAYAEGNRVSASIIDRQLVLTNERSGQNYLLQASDSNGGVLQSLGLVDGTGNFLNQQMPTDASMKVNGLLVTRSGNRGLSDIIHGLTIDLAPDAEGKSATLEVTSDVSAARKAIEDMLGKYNKLMDYLSAKVTNLKQTDGTYKRGALAGDYSIVTLRMELARQFGAAVTNSGAFGMLREVGISLDDSFKASISDAAKLESLLLSKRSDVTALFDQLSTNLTTTIGRFTGASGYMASVSSALDRQLESAKQQIDAMNSRLATREEQLYQQYGEIQAQLLTMTYMQQQFLAMYGNYNVYK